MLKNRKYKKYYEVPTNVVLPRILLQKSRDDKQQQQLVLAVNGLYLILLQYYCSIKLLQSVAPRKRFKHKLLTAVFHHLDTKLETSLGLGESWQQDENEEIRSWVSLGVILLNATAVLGPCDKLYRIRMSQSASPRYCCSQSALFRFPSPM